MSRIKYLDLCSGAGGFALGFYYTDLYDEVLLCDIDLDCCNTLIKNGFDKDKIFHGDMTKIDYKQYTDIDLIVIGSPCQSFSFAGKQKGFSDKRGELLLEFIEILKSVKPKMFLIENVKGLLSNDSGRSITRLIDALSGCGYHVKYKLMDASKYGIPQKRQRVFIFGSVIDNNFEFPPERPPATLRDAIGDLENSENNPITAKYNANKLSYFKKIPPGGCWINLPLEDQKSYMGKSFYSGGGKRGILRRLSYDEPSLTILCSPQQKQTERCHPTQDRPLTIRESARIQTFPDDYQFTGSISSQYKQIGNAVPVLLAEDFAHSIYDYWKKTQKEDEKHSSKKL